MLHTLGTGGNNSGVFLFIVSGNKMVPGGPGGTVAFTFIMLVRETLHPARLDVLQLVSVYASNRSNF